MIRQRETAGESPFVSSISLFLVSVTVIAYQVSLMRSLSISRYHHFSYLIISTALIGFGLSGIVLGFFSSSFLKRYRSSSLLLLLLFTVSIPATFIPAGTLGVDIRYLLHTGSGIPSLTLYILLTMIPFFLGALYIALVLSKFRTLSGPFYGLNLLGSGAGGILIILLFSKADALWLPLRLAVLPAIVTIFAAVSRLRKNEKKRLPLAAAVVSLAAGVLSLILNPGIRVDRYKALYHVKQLEKQGDAKLIASEEGARYRVDFWEADSFHHTLFAGPGTERIPPDQISILLDGEAAGAVFNIQDVKEAPILDSVLQSLPYRILKEKPSVLLLGETGGVNIWLAKRWNSPKIDAVQNPDLRNALHTHLTEHSGGVFQLPGVTVYGTSPRHYLKTSAETYDLIQIAAAEGMPSMNSGLYSLHEDYMLTVEAIKECVSLLSEEGIISVTRGIQAPPRDNIRMFSLFHEALRKAGFSNPGNHLIQSRNYLGVNTIISKRPVDEKIKELLKKSAPELVLDYSYYPGIEAENPPLRNKMPGPEGSPYSYYRFAAQQITAGNIPPLPNWPYRLDPVSDDSPYFHNFMSFQRAVKNLFFQDRQLSRGLGIDEGGYIILVITLLITAVSSIFLLIIPLFFIKRGTRLPMKSLVIHFLSIGFAFMFVEMVFIQKFTLFLGDPIYSVSAVLSSILITAGAGSAVQNKIRLQTGKKIFLTSLILAALLIFSVFLLDPLLSQFKSASTALRFFTAFILLIPPSFLMGFFFAGGLEFHASKIGPEEDTRKKSGLVPAAWGINGFASVTAAPLAVVLSISFNFSFVLFIAAALYFITGINSILQNRK